MCVIVNKPSSATLSESTFNSCWDRNGDGGGFVAIRNGEVIMEKGIMDKAAFLSKVKPFFGRGSQLILHFRIQSRGGVSSNLTHPFDCSEKGSDVKRYLFHNGTVRCYSALPVGQSDTSTLADWLTVLSDEDCKKLLAHLVTLGYGRFVLVIGNETFYWGDQESVVKNKVWYSNTRHETFDPKKDSRPLIGDGADSCYYSEFNYSQPNKYDQKHDRFFLEQQKKNHDEKIKLLEESLKKESKNSNVADKQFSAWSQQIISEYGLDKLTLETIREINKSSSDTPILDHILDLNA